LLIALMWMNLRRAPERWIHRYELLRSEPVAGLPPWLWIFIGGLLLTAVALYGLRQYARGALAIAPPTPYGKGAMVLLLMLWITFAASIAQQLPEAGSPAYPLCEGSFLIFACIVTAMLFSKQERPVHAAAADAAAVPRTDARWRVGWRHGLVWAAAPVVILAITGLSMAMQSEPLPGSRKRFGPEAYWREAMRVMGEWKVLGIAPSVGGEPETAEDFDFAEVNFKRNRSVVLDAEGGPVSTEEHRWRHADSVIWFDWYGREEGRPEGKTIPMSLANERLYIPWPPGDGQRGYLVLERIE
jgi:hypothetical protein